MESLQPIRRIVAERLLSGDIVLTASSGKMSAVIRRASKGEVSHAMICVQHGSIIDSTDDGVQAHNIQRKLYEADDHVVVLRLRESLDPVQLQSVLNYARSEVGTRYSKVEAARSVLGGPKPRTRKLFCSRLVARAYAAAGVNLVPDPDYCTPEALRQSTLLTEIPDMTEIVSEAELAAWARRPNPLADMRAMQNEILDVARQRDPAIENFENLDAFVQANPQWDEEIAEAYRASGYLDLWRVDYAINPWHYDLDKMEARARSGDDEGLRLYCVSTIQEFHTAGVRFAVNLAHYEGAMQVNGRRTTAQLVALYSQLVRNDQLRRDIALAWLRRHHPGDAATHLQRIEPHSPIWFSIIDRVEPRLGAIARANIQQVGSVDVCSACGDPSQDYRLVNSADAMPGVPSLRLCSDCIVIRRGSGEILVPLHD